MLTVLSRSIGEPDAGLILIAPEDVPIVTAALPWLMSSARIDDADIPVRFEPSPVKVVAARVPETVRVPFAKVIRSVSSA